MKLIIGIATNLQNFPREYVVNLLTLTSPRSIAELADVGITEHAILYNPSYPIDLARNQIIRQALEIGGDYVLFLDPDLVYRPEMIGRLIARDKDVIAPLSFRADPPHAAGAAYRRTDDRQLLIPLLSWQDQPVAVDVVACGGMLIKRRVLEAVGDPWFAFEAYRPTGETVISEEAVFCDRAQAAGFEIYVDPTVAAGRIAGRIVGCDDWLDHRERVAEYAYTALAETLAAIAR